MKTGETSYKETSFGIIPRSQLIKLEVEGIKRGITFLYKTTRSKKSKITPQLVLELHQVSFGWIFPIITDLCLDLQERLRHLPELEEKNYLEKLAGLLAWFQYRFVFIHPFNDYNGRTARMLTSFICLALNLPPIEIKVDRGFGRKRYIAAMQQADKGDYSRLEKMLLQALLESLKHLQAKSYR